MAPGAARAVREQQMIDAAVEVFSRSGFHAASMDDVADVAEISKPMLYLYLGSKEELFSALPDAGVRAVRDGGWPQRLTPTAPRTHSCAPGCWRC